METLNIALVDRETLVVQNIIVHNSLDEAIAQFPQYDCFQYSPDAYVEPGMLKGEDEMGVYFWKKYRP